jgi:hypothetical protein
VEANSTRNLWSWNDRGCGERAGYICEYKGKSADGILFICRLAAAV